MRKTLLAAAAVAAVLSIGATANQAAAMPLVAPTELGLTTPPDTATNSGLVQKAALVCGYYGCRHVWGGPYWCPHYWGWHHRYWGWRHW
jgi:hypothetical protein